MKYSVEIDLPRDRVIELFDDADNMVKWQSGLQSFEHMQDFKAFAERGIDVREQS